MDEWMALSEERLATAAQQGLQVEAMRRLRVAIEQASAKTEVYLRRMFWLNITLAMMTFALAVVAVSTFVQAMAVVKGWLS